VKYVWPLLVSAVGVVVPFVGNLEYLRATGPSKPRGLVPIGSLILGPVLMLAGMTWFLWVSIASALD
jgi:hypothetical protein